MNECGGGVHRYLSKSSMLNVHEWSEMSTCRTNMTQCRMNVEVEHTDISQKSCTLTVHGSHMLIQIPSNLTQFFKEKSSKFHLKIPARESQHCVQWNLSQKHSCYGLNRLKKKRNSNLCGTCFSSTAVVSKLLLGCSGAFPVHFVPLQSKSTQPNVHDSHADTENCIKCGFLYETDCWGYYSKF